MRARIWEDTAAMNIVSVLGFLMNDDGEVVGPERTQVLCKLLPSIHTLTHRAILAMLISGLNHADAQTFYAEKGLRVLNEWLQEGLRTPVTGTAREKLRIELYSQARALLRILDVNVQNDAARRQHAFLTTTLTKLVDLLDTNGSSEFTADWSRLNIYRRHFESSCGVPATKARPAPTPMPTATTTITSSATTTATAPTMAASSTTTSTAASGTAAPKSAPVNVLSYQPKSFLQTMDAAGGEAADEDEDMAGYVEDEDDELMMGEDVITNVTPTAASASLDNKIRQLGHAMQYGERMKCRLCRRMIAKRCGRCNGCVKCAQKDRCSPTASGNASTSASGSVGAGAGAIDDDVTVVQPTGSWNTGANGSTPGQGEPLSVSYRNTQVLGSVMDQAIYKAFKLEDFYTAVSLVQNGMDINYQRVESDRSTVLMAAAHHGRDDAVTKLLSLGANPCLTDTNGDAATAFAKRRGHVEVADKLQKAMDEWKDKKQDM